VKCIASFFYPRDAVLAMALCLCLSITSRSSVETAERIVLDFGMGASFDFPLELCPKLRT